MQKSIELQTWIEKLNMRVVRVGGERSLRYLVSTMHTVARYWMRMSVQQFNEIIFTSLLMLPRPSLSMDLNRVVSRLTIIDIIVSYLKRLSRGDSSPPITCLNESFPSDSRSISSNNVTISSLQHAAFSMVFFFMNCHNPSPSKSESKVQVKSPSRVQV